MTNIPRTIEPENNGNEFIKSCRACFRAVQHVIKIWAAYAVEIDLIGGPISIISQQITVHHRQHLGDESVFTAAVGHVRKCGRQLQREHCGLLKRGDSHAESIADAFVLTNLFAKHSKMVGQTISDVEH